MTDTTHIGWLPVYYVMVVLWGINALAQSMLWSSILKVISSVYDSEKAKKVTPYMVTSVATGNILGIVINTYLINHFGMEYAFIIPGASALVFCALSAIQMRKIENLSPEKEQKSIFSVLKDANVRKCVLPAVFHGVIKDNISLWMAVYIIETFGVDLSKSSYYILLIPVIGFLGRLLYPAIYRICRYREHLVSQIGFVICILAILPISVAKTSALIAAACLSIEYAAISLINTTLLSIFPM